MICRIIRPCSDLESLTKQTNYMLIYCFMQVGASSVSHEFSRFISAQTYYFFLWCIKIGITVLCLKSRHFRFDLTVVNFRFTVSATRRHLNWYCDHLIVKWRWRLLHNGTAIPVTLIELILIYWKYVKDFHITSVRI